MRSLSILLVLTACTTVTTVTAAPPSTYPPPTPTTNAPTTATSASSTPTTVGLSMGDVEGFEIATITLGGEELTVAVADDDVLRARGLRQVTDLGDLDGMLFVWPAEVKSRFTMRNTLIPLDIGFFDGEGRLLDVLQMIPCDTDDCPGYGIDPPFRWALEAPEGSLAGLPSGTRLIP